MAQLKKCGLSDIYKYISQLLGLVWSSSTEMSNWLLTLLAGVLFDLNASMANCHNIDQKSTCIRNRFAGYEVKTSQIILATSQFDTHQCSNIPMLFPSVSFYPPENQHAPQKWCLGLHVNVLFPSFFHAFPMCFGMISQGLPHVFPGTTAARAGSCWRTRSRRAVPWCCGLDGKATTWPMWWATTPGSPPWMCCKKTLLGRKGSPGALRWAKVLVSWIVSFLGNHLDRYTIYIYTYIVIIMIMIIIIVKNYEYKYDTIYYNITIVTVKDHLHRHSLQNK